jgi:hypothetical protein
MGHWYGVGDVGQGLAGLWGLEGTPRMLLVFETLQPENLEI